MCHKYREGRNTLGTTEDWENRGSKWERSIIYKQYVGLEKVGCLNITTLSYPHLWKVSPESSPSHSLFILPSFTPALSWFCSACSSRICFCIWTFLRGGILHIRLLPLLLFMALHNRLFIHTYIKNSLNLQRLCDVMITSKNMAQDRGGLVQRNFK